MSDILKVKNGNNWKTIPSIKGDKGDKANIVLRGQSNIFDEPFYNALTDIRAQYVIELWREPIGSLQYDGWSATQQEERILECLYSPSQKLT